ncbi:MAG TPA: alpha/beta hydrolase, partial [Burkholderiaceae bacterium]|nr:alpha/beta hydrolase [Burkholderiaceae bacterium]
RSHGRSEQRLSGYSLAAMAQDLVALLAALRAERATLVGFSYGALVALRFAVNYAPRVSQLILVEAPTIDQLHQLGDAAQQIKTELAPETIAPTLQARSVDFAKVLGFSEPTLPSARRSRRSADAAQYLMYESTLYHDMSIEPDFTDAELARLDMPVACIYGEQSHCRQAGEHWTRRVKTARMSSLANSSHFVQLDAGPALTQAIVQSLVSELYATA